MITTDTVVGGAIGPVDVEFDRYAAQVPPWLPPTVPALSSEQTLPGFPTPGAQKPHAARDLPVTLARLATELRTDLVMDPAHAYDRELDPIVLEGPAEVTAATPSLEGILRFTAATEELASVRGRSASLAGRFGPEAVERASAQLTAVFERSAGAGAVPPYWTAAAVVRPLARIAGSGGGLVLDLPRRLLDEEFGTGEIMRFEEVDFPPTLTHEPTRRFLRETGLPENGGVFRLDTEAPLQTVTECWGDGGSGDCFNGGGSADGGSGDFTDGGYGDGGPGNLAGEYSPDRRPGGFPAGQLPGGADQLIRLGQLTEGSSLVVDGATGEVLAWSEGDLMLRPVNADVSTLAFTLWLLHRVRSLAPTQGGAGSYAHLKAAVTPALTPVSAGDDGRRYWPHIWQEGTGGGLLTWS